MADRDMTCPLDGMFSTRNCGELVAHEPAKTAFVRTGARHVPKGGMNGNRRKPVLGGVDSMFLGDLATDAQQKILGVPVWVALAAAAVGAYFLAKR